ncbi:acyltransferase family protein [Streptacidiphilus jiangxiensis]|uniref:Peptidoglycan/LPS O-acetylase OafA/YrhL, contains acyltransferase and SGNH-hydrolase domains n=1 Tax=Streptacidiphilus jiangxiensis TaxID=235985 RepID=A0A1H8A0Z0_STRJI|nr:acyltransferase [Streptacidiphilus jiangxiensis]SEM64380.1 Peptidoglycan/LPS O-acetylase OafA/YrhL, contains acyltransferase and SGNH-hydrolase domains [Streptacidiphilus jiangxiensis]
MRTQQSSSLLHRAEAPPNTRSRLDALTSLRFFAAFAVFVHHFNGFVPRGGFARVPWLYPWSTIGAHGVTFFFVLSGFLLAWSWRPGTQSLGGYYWRRAGRIWPAHLVATIPAMLIFYAFAWGPDHTDVLSTLSSLFLVQTWFPSVNPSLPGNPVTWTLSVELLFYLLFPFIYRGFVRLRTRTLMLIAGLGLVAMWALDFWAQYHVSANTESWIMRNPVVYLPEFALGMAFAFALRRGWRLRLSPWPVLLLLVAYIPVYATHAVGPYGWFGIQIEATVRQTVAVISVLLIVAFVQRELDGRKSLLHRRGLVLLGAWSYCFYLVHQQVIQACYDLHLNQPASATNVWILLVMAAVGTLVAWLLYTLVEEPARKWWSAHMPKSLEARRAPSPAAPERVNA